MKYIPMYIYIYNTNMYVYDKHMDTYNYMCVMWSHLWFVIFYECFCMLLLLCINILEVT